MVKRLILVSGMPRSGTTRIGENLALASSTGMIHEPFNALVGLKQIDDYFHCVASDQVSMSRFDGIIEDIGTPLLSFKSGVFPRDHGVRRALKHVLGGRAVNSYRLCRYLPGIETIIWKDPFASLCVPLLARRHDIQSVVLVRPPWAVAASFKRMRWRFDLDDIVLRMERAGFPVIEFDAVSWSGKESYAINAALLWLIIYSYLDEVSGETENVLFLPLERVVGDMVGCYKGLYALLGLQWTDNIQRKIIDQHRTSEAPTEPAHLRAHDRHRDVASINSYWKSLLSPEEFSEIDRICGKKWGSLQETRLSAGYDRVMSAQQ